MSLKMKEGSSRLTVIGQEYNKEVIPGLTLPDNGKPTLNMQDIGITDTVMKIKYPYILDTDPYIQILDQQGNLWTPDANKWVSSRGYISQSMPIGDVCIGVSKFSDICTNAKNQYDELAAHSIPQDVLDSIPLTTLNGRYLNRSWIDCFEASHALMFKAGKYVDGGPFTACTGKESYIEIFKKNEVLTAENVLAFSCTVQSDASNRDSDGGLRIIKETGQSFPRYGGDKGYYEKKLSDNYSCWILGYEQYLGSCIDIGEYYQEYNFLRDYVGRDHDLRFLALFGYGGGCLHSDGKSQRLVKRHVDFGGDIFWSKDQWIGVRYENDNSPYVMSECSQTSGFRELLNEYKRDYLESGNFMFPNEIKNVDEYITEGCYTKAEKIKTFSSFGIGQEYAFFGKEIHYSIARLSLPKIRRKLVPIDDDFDYYASANDITAAIPFVIENTRDPLYIAWQLKYGSFEQYNVSASEVIEKNKKDLIDLNGASYIKIGKVEERS